jgi:ketosteroid isomerase-like protein
MSRENVEVIRHAIEHLSDTGELAEECYDPEVEYTTQPDAPMHTTYQGLQGLQRSLESLREAWDSMKLEAREFIEADEAIVALTHFRLRGHSGVELEVDQAWTYQMRNGKIWRMEQYGSKQEALEAAGLRE